MELGQYQLQIFIGLVVILGAAFVALICDFLKGNNEQLRELTIELRVRREEEQKRAQQTEMAPRSEQGAAQAAQAAPKAAATHRERKRAVNSDALAAMERGAALAS